MNIFLIVCVAALLFAIASFLGLSWLSLPRDRNNFSKPFNRTIPR